MLLIFKKKAQLTLGKTRYSLYTLVPIALLTFKVIQGQ